jgi:hypothetical protein
MKVDGDSFAKVTIIMATPKLYWLLRSEKLQKKKKVWLTTSKARIGIVVNSRKKYRLWKSHKNDLTSLRFAS